MVRAVDVPVTLKMRTGPTPDERNAVRLARLAEAAGVAMITVHGRTRAERYAGSAEYDTIAAVKAALRIPVVANGDIDSPAKAAAVLHHTGADAVMIGRAAMGRPWIFREVAHYLATGEQLPPPSAPEIHALLRAHLQDHYAFYGEFTGVRTARKHVGWYLAGMPGWAAMRNSFNRIESPEQQLASIDRLHDALATHRGPLDTDAANDGSLSGRQVA